MTTIRNDGPRHVETKTLKGPVGPNAPEGIKKPTVTIAAHDTVGASALERAAKSLESGSAGALGMGAAQTSELAVARFDTLAATHLNVALEGQPAARFAVPAASEPLFSEKTFAQLAAVPQKEIKQEIVQAGAKQWLKLAEGAQQHAIATDPKNKPDLTKVASFMATVAANAKSNGTAISTLPKDTSDALTSLAGRFAGASIEELVTIVMMTCSKDAQEDVGVLLKEMQAVSEQRKLKREQIAKLKERLTAEQGDARTADDRAAAAEQNAATAEAAAKTAQEALDKLKAATAGGTAAADAAAAVANGELDAAKVAKDAADAAVAAADATRTTVQGHAAQFPQTVNDPIATVQPKWSDNISWLGLPLSPQMELGGLVYMYNQGKPANERVLDLTTLMLKLNCKIPALSYDHCVTNMSILQSFAAQQKNGTSDAQRKAQMERYYTDLQGQAWALGEAKNKNVPVDIARIIGSTRLGNPERRAALRAAYDEALAEPRSAAKYAKFLQTSQELHKQEKASPTQSDAAYLASIDEMITRSSTALEKLPRVARFEMEAGAHKEAQGIYGLSEGQTTALEAIFNALPEAQRGGKTTWYEWVGTCPNLRGIASDFDFAGANANRQAIDAFLKSEASKIGQAAVAAQSGAATTLADKTAAADAANGAVSNARAELAKLATTEANVARANGAAFDARANANAAKDQAAKEAQEAAAAQNAIDKAQDEMDGLSELNSEKQLKMQIYMDRMQKAQQMLSNLLANFAKTKESIIGNMK